MWNKRRILAAALGVMLLISGSPGIDAKWAALFAQEVTRGILAEGGGEEVANIPEEAPAQGLSGETPVQGETPKTETPVERPLASATPTLNAEPTLKAEPTLSAEPAVSAEPTLGPAPTPTAAPPESVEPAETEGPAANHPFTPAGDVRLGAYEAPSTQSGKRLSLILPIIYSMRGEEMYSNKGASGGLLSYDPERTEEGYHPALAEAVTEMRIKIDARQSEDFPLVSRALGLEAEIIANGVNLGYAAFEGLRVSSSVAEGDYAVRLLVTWRNADGGGEQTKTLYADVHVLKPDSMDAEDPTEPALTPTPSPEEEGEEVPHPQDEPAEEPAQEQEATEPFCACCVHCPFCYDEEGNPAVEVCICVDEAGVHTACGCLLLSPDPEHAGDPDALREACGCDCHAVALDVLDALEDDICYSYAELAAKIQDPQRGANVTLYLGYNDGSVSGRPINVSGNGVASITALPNGIVVPATVANLTIIGEDPMGRGPILFTDYNLAAGYLHTIRPSANGQSFTLKNAAVNGRNNAGVFCNNAAYRDISMYFENVTYTGAQLAFNRVSGASRGYVEIADCNITLTNTGSASAPQEVCEANEVKIRGTVQVYSRNIASGSTYSAFWLVGSHPSGQLSLTVEQGAKLTLDSNTYLIFQDTATPTVVQIDGTIDLKTDYLDGCMTYASQSIDTLRVGSKGALLIDHYRNAIFNYSALLIRSELSIASGGELSIRRKGNTTYSGIYFAAAATASRLHCAGKISIAQEGNNQSAIYFAGAAALDVSGGEVIIQQASATYGGIHFAATGAVNVAEGGTLDFKQTLEGAAGLYFAAKGSISVGRDSTLKIYQEKVNTGFSAFHFAVGGTLEIFEGATVDIDRYGGVYGTSYAPIYFGTSNASRLYCEGKLTINQRGTTISTIYFATEAEFIVAGGQVEIAQGENSLGGIHFVGTGKVQVTNGGALRYSQEKGLGAFYFASTANVVLESGSQLCVYQKITSNSYGTIHFAAAGSLTVNDGTLLIERGGTSSSPCIRFSASGGTGLAFISPRLVALTQNGGPLITTAASRTMTVQDIKAMNLLAQSGVNYIWNNYDLSAFTVYATLATNGSVTAANITSLNNGNRGDALQAVPLTAANLNLSNSSRLVFGKYVLGLDPVYTGDTKVSGNAPPNSEQEIREYSTTTGTPLAQSRTIGRGNGPYQVAWNPPVLEKDSRVYALNKQWVGYQEVYPFEAHIYMAPIVSDFMVVVPETLPFEAAKVSAKAQLVDRQNTDWHIVVYDRRAGGTTWKLFASMTQDLSANDGTKLTNGLVMVKGATKTPLDPSLLLVAEQPAHRPGQYTVDWTRGEGPHVALPPLTGTPGKEYTTIITWTLAFAP